MIVKPAGPAALARVLTAALLGATAIPCSSPAMAESAVATSPAPPAISIEARPDWVKDRALPAASAARVAAADSGTAFLLVDEQFRSHATGHDDWFRLATMVANRSGLEAGGQITVSYDPGFQTVGINFVLLIRDGKVIDLTRDTAFRVVEREDDLDDGIISGSLKLIANLRDVRVGDVVDYAVTYHSRSPLWPGQSFYHFSERYSDEVAQRALRLVWPADAAPRYKAINSGMSFAVRKTASGDGTEWEWIANDPPAFKAETDVPATAFIWGKVDISTMKDWAELARWAVGLYQGDESLPDDFAARLDAIAKASPTQAERFTEAVRYVQDNIRYVGEELGEGSYVPRRPKTVLSRSYGDCKDKSLLLAIALRRLGIDAVPALVTTVAGARLPDRLPSPLQFNHVIVRAVVDGKVVWIDATGAHSGGRGTRIVPSDLGYALPIREGQTALEKISGYAELAGRETVLERFTIDEKADVPLKLHVETHFTDARADNVRANWASNSAKTLADSNLKFYRERFPGLAESKPLELADDRDANALTMIEDYTLARDAFIKGKLGSKLITRAFSLRGILPDRQGNPRVSPLAINAFIVNEHTIEMHVADRTLDGWEDVAEKAGPVSYSRRTTALPDGLRIVYSINTGTQPDVPATDAEAIYALSDKIKDAMGTEWYLDKTPRAAAAPKGVDPAVWAAIKPDMAKVTDLLKGNDQPSQLEALTLLSAIAEKVPHPSPAAGLVEGMRGAVLSDLRRPQAALAALRLATAQYEGNAEVFRLWIAYEIDLGTPETTAQAIARTGKLHPAVIAAIDKRWVEIALQKVYALPMDQRERSRGNLCIALVDGGWKQSPLTGDGAAMQSCALVAHSLRGELAEARAGLAKAPPTSTLVQMSLDRRHQMLWPELDKGNADHFRKSLERDAARAAEAVKAAPKDYGAITYQMKTLRALGRFAEAVAIGKPLATDKVQLEVAGNEAFWLANEYALNLNALGRNDEGLAVMDLILSLGIDNYPELSALAVNRSEMLLASGHYQQAFDAMGALETQHIDKLNTYGKMWIWADKACALRALGKPDQAAAMDAKVALDPSGNWNAYTSAAACRNDIKAIADAVIKRLRSEADRPGALGLFITFEVPEARTAFERAKLKALHDALALPEVQAELAKWGRAIRYAGTSQGWADY